MRALQNILKDLEKFGEMNKEDIPDLIKQIEHLSESKRKILANINMLQNDCQRQYNAIDNEQYDDMWDTKDLHNWAALIEMLDRIEKEINS